MRRDSGELHKGHGGQSYSAIDWIWTPVTPWLGFQRPNEPKANLIIMKP